MSDIAIYDVAIAGGGLAGLTTAIQCVDAGYSVLLVEKEKYPFHKVCGEYISNESFNFLQRLGVPLQQWGLPFINQLQVSDADGKIYNFKLHLGGFGISRYKLDDALYNIALRKGVQVLTQTKVTDITFDNNLFHIQTNNGNFNSTAAVAGFGKRSNLDVKWKRPFITSKSNRLNNYIGIKYHVRYNQPADVITLHNFKNGYCGISNIEGGKCCLCYLTTAENLKRNNTSIPQMEKNVLRKNPKLEEIFSQAEFLYQEPLTISQVSFDKKNQVQNHVLLTGDAAGMITPLCGNGMSMAMHAGKMAFANIHLYMQQKITRSEMEHRYTSQWRQAFGQRLFTGRMVQRLFGNNKTTYLFLEFMNKNAWLAQKLISSTHGKPF